MRTRVKVCGMTRIGDACDAVDLGVDAIGMILHANSPRTISLEQAMAIRAAIPAFVSVVGVFVDAEKELIQRYEQEIGIDLVQLHGNESPEFADDLGLRYIRAIRAKSREQVELSMSSYASSHAVLLDPYVKGQHGGTGQLLDSGLWPEADELDKPVILAGGLNAKNVYQRIIELRPYAVDINSGVESSPGVKSKGLLRQAIRRIQMADVELNGGLKSNV